MSHILHFQDFSAPECKDRGVGNNAYARHKESNWKGPVSGQGKVEKADKEAPESWYVRFRVLFLYTGDVLFHVEWCTRQL